MESTKRTGRFKFIVTGFGPFGIHEVNISSVAVRLLRARWHANELLHSCSIDLIVFDDIPVVYRDTTKTSDAIWKLEPDLVVHVGLNSCSDALTLESLAFNSGYHSQDVHGCECGFDGCCIPEGQDILHCQLNLEKTCDMLLEKGIPAIISDDPGHFLCGYIYYLSLSRYPDRSLFVHVPSPSEKYDARVFSSALFEVLRDLAAQKGIPFPTCDLDA